MVPLKVKRYFVKKSELEYSGLGMWAKRIKSGQTNHVSPMNRKLLTLIFSLFAVLLLVFTNPSTEEHKAAVKVKMNAFMQATLKEQSAFSKDALSGIGAGLGALMGGYVVDKMIDAGIVRNNYLLFSTTTFVSEGKSKTIGVGVLGNVFLSSKVDEALKNTKD